MAFYDYSFLFAFLPVVLAVYYLVPARLRNGWFLFASLTFYFFADPAFLPVLVMAAIVNYSLGLGVSGLKPGGGRKALLAIGIIFNLSLLCSFKYLGFFAGTLRVLSHFKNMSVPSAVLPIGISFYTFTSMSYLIDLYRGQVQAAGSMVTFSSFLTMFPHIVSGPIVRFREIRGQFEQRTFQFNHLTEGMALFFMGFAKKILIADSAGYFCDPLFSQHTPGFFQAWTSALLFSGQIYFDFSGYTDMAIGLALLLGFEYPQNFNSPYKSATFTDFWRSWHMTLSRWLRDYLYISLGGNKKGKIRTYLNIMLTMLLGGLWHGASWNFVAWGGYHGALLAIERLFGIRVAPKGKAAKALRTVFTFIMVTIGWGVFFRCKNFGQSLRWLKSMFFFDGLGPMVSWKALAALAAMLAIIFGFKNSWELRKNYKLYWVVFVIICFVVSLMVAYTKGGMPFLYARF